MLQNFYAGINHLRAVLNKMNIFSYIMSLAKECCHTISFLATARVLVLAPRQQKLARAAVPWCCRAGRRAFSPVSVSCRLEKESTRCRARLKAYENEMQNSDSQLRHERPEVQKVYVTLRAYLIARVLRVGPFVTTSYKILPPPTPLHGP